MSNPYDYYEAFCKCDGSANTVGDAGGLYDFMADFCVCGAGIVLLGMRDLEGNETTSYPVSVYNVNFDLIGKAGNKNQYRNVWNSDPVNEAIGILGNGPGPFSFYLALNQGQNPPPYVIGDPNETVDEGIYGIEYAIQYE